MINKLKHNGSLGFSVEQLSAERNQLKTSSLPVGVSTGSARKDFYVYDWFIKDRVRFSMLEKEVEVGTRNFINVLTRNGTIYSLIGELNAEIHIQLITERAMGDAKIVYQKIKKERGKVEIKSSKKT